MDTEMGSWTHKTCKMEGKCWCYVRTRRRMKHMINQMEWVHTLVCLWQWCYVFISHTYTHTDTHTHTTHTHTHTHATLTHTHKHTTHTIHIYIHTHTHTHTYTHSHTTHVVHIVKCFFLLFITEIKSIQSTTFIIILDVVK